MTPEGLLQHSGVRFYAPATSHFTLKVLPEQLIRLLHLLRQTLQGFLSQFLRHPIKSLGNAAGDAGKSTASEILPPCRQVHCEPFQLPHKKQTLPAFNKHKQNVHSFHFMLPAAPRSPDCPARHGKAGTAPSRLRLLLRSALYQTPAAYQHSVSPR